MLYILLRPVFFRCVFIFKVDFFFQGVYNNFFRND